MKHNKLSVRSDIKRLLAELGELTGSAYALVRFDHDVPELKAKQNDWAILATKAGDNFCRCMMAHKELEEIRTCTRAVLEEGKL